MAGRGAGGRAQAAKTVLSLVKNPFQKHKEEAEEKKRRQAEEAARELQAFEADMARDSSKRGAFVRGEIINSSSAGKQQAPQPVATLSDFAMDDASPPPVADPAAGKKRRQLDELLEEMKREQATRESKKTRSEPSVTDDSSNLFITNLGLDVTEDAICREFGRFGPIASVKIMWPRPEDRGRTKDLTAFVCFMTRRSAEKAKREMDVTHALGGSLRISWSKAIPLPAKPLYDPSAADAPAALPFGAQIADPPAGSLDKPQATVTVQIPTDSALRRRVHRTVEFVVLHGEAFEATLMEREKGNPHYSFLFDFDSAAHVYYRWRLYSVLQGDAVDAWRTAPFRMFKGGPLWIPPAPVEVPGSVRGLLSAAQREHLERLLERLSLDARSIGDAMVWIVEHGDAADEIASVLVQSLTVADTPLSLKIARLFLVSDVLHNSSARVSNAWKLRTAIEPRLDVVFEHLRVAHKSIPARMRAEHLRKNVNIVLTVWERWMIYPPSSTKRWHAIFSESSE